MTLIRDFIISRLFGLKSHDFIFEFWSPYSGRKLEIDISKNGYFCNALIERDFMKALSVVKSHFALYDHLQNGSVKVFNEDQDKKIISLKPGHRNCGYSPAEWNLFYTAALATILWSFLKDDDMYKYELGLGIHTKDKVVSGLLEIINEQGIPDYSTDLKGAYKCIA